jgi:hypothetical protein
VAEQRNHPHLGNRFFIEPWDLSDGKFKRFYNAIGEADRDIVRKICGTLSNRNFVERVVAKLKTSRRFDEKFRHYWSDKNRINEISDHALNCLKTLGLDNTRIAPQFVSATGHEIKQLGTEFNNCAQDPGYLKSVQGELKKFGFYRSKVDGLDGPGTQRALVQAHYLLGDWADNNVCVSISERRLLYNLRSIRALSNYSCEPHTRAEADAELKRLQKAGLTELASVGYVSRYTALLSEIERLEKKLIAANFYKNPSISSEPDCRITGAEIRELAAEKLDKKDPAPNAQTLGLSKAPTCEDDPALCSVVQLCGKAASTVNGDKAWNTDAKAADYVALAKSTGVTCGVKPKPVVVAKAPTCEDDPALCSVVQLCGKAASTVNGDRAWNTDATAVDYVALAKSTGVTCGVKPKPVVVAKAPTCEDDPTKCSVIELCQQATGTNASGEKFWRMDAALQTYVDTAKSTGVTCGVVPKVIETAKLETCENTPSKCSLAELCQRAISFETGKLGWTTAVNDAPYVQFAKNSGMTCGVQEDLVAAVPEQKQVEPPAPKKVLKYHNRKALVIGNANYVDQTPLKNPINDAKAVASKLEQIGFEVTYKENLKVREFGRTITDFEQALQGSDIGLFYYAGHGIEVEKQNYLIPIDAEIRTPRDVRFETVMLEDAISASLNTGKLSMVLVDACRDNPFAGQLGSGTRSIARGLSVVEVETGPVNQIVSFAAASGEVAEDGSGNNSPYATALIELLDEPNLEVGKMFRLLGERVSEMTGGKQQPVKRDNLRGEDIFLVVE